MKRFLLTLFLCATAQAAQHTTIVPAIASIHGANGTFFRSDLHLFNHGNGRVSVQLTYRCWSGQNCGAPATIVLEPRTNRRIEDAANTLFAAPETAGALEIVYDDAGGTITARSRLFSSSIGQVVPGLDASAAHRVSLINFVPLSASIRSNAGGYNPGDGAATTAYELHRADGTLISTTPKVLSPRESFQFSVRGSESAAYLRVTSDVPIFAYVSAIDNQTGDSVFETAVEDSSEVLVECSQYKFSPGSGSTPIVLKAGGTYRLRFHSIDTTHGLSAIQPLGIEPATIAPDADYVVDVTVPEALRGNRLNFSCTRVCGSGHGNMYGAIEIQ